MAQIQENPEKSISDELDGLWKQLTRNQQRFAVAMLGSPSKKEAAEAIGVEPDTVYRWGNTVERVIELLLQNTQESALTILTGLAVRAAMAKQDGLDSEDERIKQGVATEILDRVLGRTAQPIDQRHSGGLNVNLLTGNIDPDKL